MQTAFFIQDVTFGISTPVSNFVNLTVDFQIHNSGPAHVAGLVWTIDGWKTSHVEDAVFEALGQGFEFWRAVVGFTSNDVPAFEFVVFCDDFGGGDQVPRIWNTNGGNRFVTGSGVLLAERSTDMADLNR
jgi:hypothetical protein